MLFTADLLYTYWTTLTFTLHYTDTKYDSKPILTCQNCIILYSAKKAGKPIAAVQYQVVHGKLDYSKAVFHLGANSHMFFIWEQFNKDRNNVWNLQL